MAAKVGVVLKSLHHGLSLKEAHSIVERNDSMLYNLPSVCLPMLNCISFFCWHTFQSFIISLFVGFDVLIDHRCLKGKISLSKIFVR